MQTMLASSASETVWGWVVIVLILATMSYGMQATYLWYKYGRKNQ